MIPDTAGGMVFLFATHGIWLVCYLLVTSRDFLDLLRCSGRDFCNILADTNAFLAEGMERVSCSVNGFKRSTNIAVRGGKHIKW